MTHRHFVTVARALPALALLGLSACGTPSHTPEVATPQPVVQTPAPTTAPAPRARPVMYAPSRPLQCVPYARDASGISIRGDAWTWWRQADGRYPRGERPREGAVMLLNTGHRRGHLAYVKEVRGPREIIVDHANWLNRGRIHENTPVRDISRNGDWSKVRVWYVPGNQLGASGYEVVGFIYPNQRTAQR